jgi:hypothetical protein
VIALAADGPLLPTVQEKLDCAGGVCAVTDEHPVKESTG